MSQFRWAEFEMIYLNFVVVIFGLGWVLINHIKKKKILTLAHPRGIKFLFQEVSTKRLLVKKISVLVGLIFLVLSLMRFQTPGGRIEIRSEGIEIMILADVSESMMAEDLRPNRLSQMKYDLIRFVDLLGGHQVGLVAFAGSAHVLSPLTSDPNALKMYIDSLSPLSVSSQGTHVGAAIEVGLEAFRRGGKENSENTKVTRAFVIASDGEDHEPETLNKVKEILAENDIRVYTLAYGTTDGATIPDRDSLGYLRGQKRDRKGMVITTKVNGTFLKELANFGGGEFEFAVAGGDHIKKIISSINRLEKQINQSESAISYNEHFLIFGWIGFIHLIFALMLPLKKSEFKKWLGRVIPLFFIFVPIGAKAEFTSILGWYYYKKAMKSIVNENYSLGFQNLSKALVYDPDSSEIQNALGVLFSKSEQWDKALAAFQIAEKLASSPDEQFSARFNIGVVHHAQKNVDPALQAYLKALEIKPESKETKINIELLIQSMQGQGNGDGEKSNNASESQNDFNQDPQKYKESKPQPKQFQSKELSEADMKRILDELRNQEQKIRTEFNKREQKERIREKDW